MDRKSESERPEWFEDQLGENQKRTAGLVRIRARGISSAEYQQECGGRRGF